MGKIVVTITHRGDGARSDSLEFVFNNVHDATRFIEECWQYSEIKPYVEITEEGEDW